MTGSSGSKQMIRGTAIVSGLTLLSRFLGFLRDLSLAILFGAGQIADCYFVAFRIPNLLRSFVAEGALTAAFVPIFSSKLQEGSGKAQEAFSAVSGFVLIVTLALTILGIIFAPEIVHAFAPGFGRGTEQEALCILLTRIMLPYIIFVSFVALLNGALNAFQIYGVSATAQCVLNIALILGSLLALPFASNTSIIIVSTSVLIGGIAQIIVQFPSMRKANIKMTPRFRVGIGFRGAIFKDSIFRDPTIRELIRLMLPALIGATVYQITIFLNTMLASLLVTGSVSWLFYADRLVQFPLGTFSIALASVLLPALSQANSQKNAELFQVNLINSLRYTSFIMMPLMFLICFYAEPLTILIFQRGAFSTEAAHMTAIAVQALGIGIWTTSCHSMLVRALIAQKNTLTPTLIGFGSMLISLTISLLFMGPPQPSASGSLASVVVFLQSNLALIFSFAPLGHVGLALSSSVGSLFSFCLTIYVLKVKQPSLCFAPFWLTSFKSSIASAALVFTVWQLHSIGLAPFFEILVGGTLGTLSFIVVSFILGSRELKESLALGGQLKNRFVS